MHNVLIIRPLKEAHSLYNSLKLQNIKSTLYPLFKTCFLPICDLGRPQAFIITSKNALYALEGRQDLKDIPVYGVGEQTSYVAKNIGFTRVFCGSETSRGLTQFVLKNADPKKGPLLHISGEKVTGKIVETLRKHGFEANRHLAYKIEDPTELPPSLIKDLHNKTLTHVMFFSPRTTEVFVNLLKESELTETTTHMTSLCLSKNVAEKAGLIPWKDIWISPNPTTEAMTRYFDEKKQ